MKNQTHETHPHFPSGEWEGFYVYKDSSQRHHKQLELEFTNGRIHAEGVDDVGAFTFRGKYNAEIGKCYFVKYYSTHVVHYEGDVDENGIWGKWFFTQQDLGIPKELFKALSQIPSAHVNGGFHIWPKGKSFSAQEHMEREEVTKRTFTFVN
ncbi:MAG: hypothetical protein AAGK97_01675 [Bacteroidota bacterium]